MKKTFMVYFRIFVVCLILLVFAGCDGIRPHKHDWRVIKETCSPPSAQRFNHNNNSSYELTEGYLFGITEILEECSVCGRRIKTRMLGIDTSAGGDE